MLRPSRTGLGTFGQGTSSVRAAADMRGKSRAQERPSSPQKPLNRVKPAFQGTHISGE